MSLSFLIENKAFQYLGELYIDLRPVNKNFLEVFSKLTHLSILLDAKTKTQWDLFQIFSEHIVSIFESFEEPGDYKANISTEMKENLYYLYGKDILL